MEVNLVLYYYFGKQLGLRKHGSQSGALLLFGKLLGLRKHGS